MMIVHIIIPKSALRMMIIAWWARLGIVSFPSLPAWKPTKGVPPGRRTHTKQFMTAEICIPLGIMKVTH